MALAVTLLALMAAAAVRAAADDAAALQDLKEALTGSTPNLLANWTAAGDPCMLGAPRWAGVTCTNGRVTAM